MPRPAKPARLYLRKTPGRPYIWVIHDRGLERSTGCGPDDVEGAQRALKEYLGQSYTPPSGPRPLETILVADVMMIYLREHAPTTRSLGPILRCASPIIEWWEGKTLADVKGRTCRDYWAWRTSQTVHQQEIKRTLKTPRIVKFVTKSTARSELGYLAAAINYYNKEHGPLPAVPVVTLPEKSPPRERWLTREEAARIIRASLRNELARHIARFVILGVYTGTRSQALFELRWLPSISGGWVDLEAGVIHRRGQGVTETSKRQPPLKLPDRLLAHLKRWHAIDARYGITHVIHFQGAEITKLRRSWATARHAAGLGNDVTPHTLRHTAATWLMQSGCDVYEAAGFLGMTVEVLEHVYGHHHPDFQSGAANSSRRRLPRVSQETPRTKSDLTKDELSKTQQIRGS